MEALALFTKKFKRSFKDTNISLATKLKQCEKEKIDALHELDVLKRKHLNLEKDMHSLFETNELLESKVAKLQVELDKANATFKKLNAGSQILDEVLSSQKVALDRGGLGYKAEGSLKSKAREKMIFGKPNSNAPASLVANKAKSPVKEKNVKHARTKPPKVKKQCPVVKSTTKRGEVNSFKFKPTCHYCGIMGHIRPNCFKLHGFSFTNHVYASHNRDNYDHLIHMKSRSPHCRKLHSLNISHTHVAYYHDYHDKHVPMCHFCGVKGHIQRNCFKLHGYPNAPLSYHSVNNNEGRYKFCGYGCDRSQKPSRRVIHYRKITNVIPKHVPKVGKIEKVKTRLIWVRRTDLKTNVDLPSNPLDDNGLSGGVNLVF
ncbi:hypothetical protein RHGRI_001666 [Rhododendron griersonianum]|nr:hypothetical protein RHGRI_001666 [Rhododendron griersonianum]